MIYLIVYLAIGMILTYVSWEREQQYNGIPQQPTLTLVLSVILLTLLAPMIVLGELFYKLFLRIRYVYRKQILRRERVRNLTALKQQS